MGSTNISGLGNIFDLGMVSGFGSAAVLQQDDTQGFTDVMKRMTVQTGNSEYSGSKMEEAGEKVLEPEACRCRRDIVKESAQPYTEEDQKLVNDRVDSYANEVKEALEEELSVTEEQIEDAMEKLGITYLELLNPNVLVSLVAELSGCEDAGALLCNSEFLQAVQSVGELSEELLGELGISKEELQKLYEAAQEVTGDPNAGPADEQGRLNEEALIGQSDAAASEDVKPIVLDATGIPEEALEDTEVIQKPMNGSVKAEPDTDAQTQEDQITVKTAEPLEEAGSESKNAGDDSELNQEQASAKEKPQSGAAEAALPHQNTRETVYVPSTGETVIYKEQVDVSNIIRQIVSFSKVNITAEAATMEMQLNPEHLGKLYLEITAKEGSVSAHIMAQNEMVREALESQIADLKQSLNQAGVRVDAVEVTVGNHEFERNLEQNAKQQEQQAEEQENAKNRTRRINLNELDELSGIMTEEETLAAQMMADHGNSVDYTA